MNENMSIYKKDWKEAKQRMTDWWQGKKLDRPAASVIAPIQAGEKPELYPDKALKIDRIPDKYTDFDTVFQNLRYRLSNTFWGGEAFPWHYIYFGPLFHVTYFGANPDFKQNTTWYDTCFDSLDDILDFNFNEDNRWWMLFQEMTKRSASQSRGQYLVKTGSVTALIDTLSILLGSERLLLAMASEPEKVKAALGKLMPYGKVIYDRLYSITNPVNNGSIDWMGLWCPGKVLTTQCDLSVMISPQMFDEFVKDDLQSTYDYVDYGIYHLDGKEEIRHLDILLSMDKIKLIQWVPSKLYGDTDNRDPMKWIPLFRRIQAAGKKVLIICPPERITPLLKCIDRDLAYLRVRCPDLETAHQALRDLEHSAKQ